MQSSLTASTAADLRVAAAPGRSPLPAAETHAAKLWFIAASSAGLQCSSQCVQLPSAQPRSLPAAAPASAATADGDAPADAVRQRARAVYVAAAARPLHAAAATAAAAEHLQ